MQFTPHVISCWGWEAINNFTRNSLVLFWQAHTYYILYIWYITIIICCRNLFGLFQFRVWWGGGRIPRAWEQPVPSVEVSSTVQYSTVQYSTRGGADRPGRETLKLILTFVFPLIIYKKWHSVWKLLMLLGNCWQSHDFGKQGVVLLQGCWVYWVQVGCVCSLFCSPHAAVHQPAAKQG